MSELPYEYDGLLPVGISGIAGKAASLDGTLHLSNRADADGAPDRLRLALIANDEPRDPLCHFDIGIDHARLLAEQLLVVARRLEMDKLEGGAMLDSL